ncbi:MAG: RHS repeat-associated core domain-containing protein [Candidatus Methanofastidiosa archaeon]|nr:RHS repeat-associated core domain-containing protein [Candidatus Methanofastidiosa archaeon]
MKPAGKIKSTYNYKLYCVELPPTTSTANRMKFTGHERDVSTGYDYMHARFYSSSMARFLRPDPINGKVESSQSWNLYAYVGNNPINSIDPTGLTTYLFVYATTSDPCSQKALENTAKKAAADVENSETYSEENDRIIIQQVSQPEEVVALQQTTYETGAVDLTVIGHATAPEGEGTEAGMLMNVTEKDVPHKDPSTGFIVLMHEVTYIRKDALTTEHFTKMDVSNFASNSSIKLIGCNTATPGKAGQPSLALDIAVKTGVSTKGYIGAKEFVLKKPEQWIEFIPIH